MSVTLIQENLLLLSCQDCEHKHKTVVATYRSHLLAAVQVSNTHIYKAKAKCNPVEHLNFLITHRILAI